MRLLAEGQRRPAGNFFKYPVEIGDIGEAGLEASLLNADIFLN